MTQTSGHVGDELQLLRIQHFLVRKFVCGIKGSSLTKSVRMICFKSEFTAQVELRSALDGASDDGQSPFVDFGSAGDLTGGRVRETVQPDQFGVGQSRAPVA